MVHIPVAGGVACGNRSIVSLMSVREVCTRCLAKFNVVFTPKELTALRWALEHSNAEDDAERGGTPYKEAHLSAYHKLAQLKK